MRLDRVLAAITFCVILSVFVFSRPATVSSAARDIIYGETAVEWSSIAPDAGVVLTLAGPGGLYLRQDYPAGNWPRFSLLDEQGRPRPEGIYKWELVAQADDWRSSSQSDQFDSRIRAGWFRVRGGRVVAEQAPDAGQPVAIEDNAPENSLYVDNQGRVGVGTSVPRAQLHLKAIDPRLTIEDAQTGGRGYTLRSQEGGDGSLGLFDETTGKARWLVDGEGRVGIGTPHPTATLTVEGYIEATKGFLVNGRPLSSLGGLIGSAPLYAEGTSNNFFGTGAGAANSAGTQNSFFGALAGNLNTTGSMNSFFGNASGFANTTGLANTFYGRTSGYANTTGSYNAFFGGAAG
ncbi:MAG: hypothetical protein EHM61_29050, partial [Acidobacteria bacterium]